MAQVLPWVEWILVHLTHLRAFSQTEGLQISPQVSWKFFKWVSKDFGGKTWVWVWAWAWAWANAGIVLLNSLEQMQELCFLILSRRGLGGVVVKRMEMGWVRDHWSSVRDLLGDQCLLSTDVERSQRIEAIFLQAFTVSAGEEEVLRRKLLILHNRWSSTAGLWASFFLTLLWFSVLYVTLLAIAWHKRASPLCAIATAGFKIVRIPHTKQYRASLKQPFSLAVTWRHLVASMQWFLCRLSLCRELQNFNIDLSPVVLDKAKCDSTNWLWIVLWVYCRVKDFGQKIAADDYEASQDSLEQISKSLMFLQNWVRFHLRSKLDIQQCLLLWSRFHICQNSSDACSVFFWQSWEDTNSFVHSEIKGVSSFV